MSEPTANLPPAPPVPQPAVPPSAAADSVFRGPNGIRAGWRALIFLGLVVGLVAAVNLVVALVMHFLLHRAPHFGAVSSLTPTAAVLSDGSIFLFTGLAALIMCRIEHRKWGQYGLPARSAFRNHFWLGILVGFLAISASLLAIFALHGFHLAGVATHGKTLFLATAAWSAAFVIVGLGEEFAFRGYLQFTLTTGMGFWPAAILLSALFGSLTRAIRGKASSDCSPWSASLCCSVCSCAAPAISGWLSASTPDGIGDRLFSTA